MASMKEDQNVVWTPGSDIASICTHLEELRRCWAKTLGITGPQWMIISVLAETDNREGLPVKAVSKELQVDPSFVALQSKLLEKQGFLLRKTSIGDGRVVSLSLTDQTRRRVFGLASYQEALNEFVFSDFGSDEPSELTGRHSVLKKRLEDARLKVALDCF
jgi:MarR family transcriptional regulator, organic hydroperoxide resistance regulator